MWRFVFGLIPNSLIHSNCRWLKAAYLQVARRAYAEGEDMSTFFADEEVRPLALWLQGSYWLSRLFSWADDRHRRLHSHSDYEACGDWLCRLAWVLENGLWYEGRAET